MFIEQCHACKAKPNHICSPRLRPSGPCCQKTHFEPLKCFQFWISYTFVLMINISKVLTHCGRNVIIKNCIRLTKELFVHKVI